MKEIENVLVSVDGNIGFINYQDVKDNALGYISLYDGAVVDEENYQTAKKEVATLRKIKEKLDTKRKEVKAEYLKPFNEFEAQVKELIGLFDTPIETLNSQIKAIDDKDKETKRGEIKKLYDRLVTLEDYMPFDEIFNEKWLNKTFPMSDIAEILRNTQEEIVADVKIIKANCSDNINKAKDYYKATKDLALTLEKYRDAEAMPFAYKTYEVNIDISNEKEFIAFMEKIGADYKEV